MKQLEWNIYTSFEQLEIIAELRAPLTPENPLEIKERGSIFFGTVINPKSNLSFKVFPVLTSRFIHFVNSTYFRR